MGGYFVLTERLKRGLKKRRRGRRKRKTYKEPLLKKWKRRKNKGTKEPVFASLTVLSVHAVLDTRDHGHPHEAYSPVCVCVRVHVLMCQRDPHTWKWPVSKQENMTSMTYIEAKKVKRELVHRKAISCLHWPEHWVGVKDEWTIGGHIRGKDYSIQLQPALNGALQSSTL